MNELRKFFETKAGRGVGIVLAAASLAVLFLVLRGNLAGSAAAAASRERTFICAKTGKAFPYEIKAGDILPVMSPYSGEKTGYQAELCYWTAEGGVKSEPTPVLLNEYAGRSGPTFCPDCKRLVVGHNPRAEAGRTPPPTQATYAQARKDLRNDR